jgi:hypothetical protein
MPLRTKSGYPACMERGHSGILDRVEGGDFVIRRGMTGEEALALILDRLPAFRAHLDEESAFGEGGEPLLLHLVMGDLGRYYMAVARHDDDLRRRYWEVVEQLASSEGQYVDNAVHTSLIEWFAWGDEDEKNALVTAYPLLGRETRRMVSYFADSLPPIRDSQSDEM